MVTQKEFEELRAKEEEHARLGEEIARRKREVLLALPSRLGFASLSELIEALRGLDEASVAPTTSTTREAPKKSRRKITQQVRDEVAKLFDEGKTGKQIAEAVGISAPSVHNIKKDLNLVKPRA